MEKGLKQLFRLATSLCLSENYVIGAKDPPEKHLSEHSITAVEPLLVLMKKFSLLLFIKDVIAVVQSFEQFVPTRVHDSLNRFPGHLKLMIKPRFLTEDERFPFEIVKQLSHESSLHHLSKQIHSRLMLRLHFCYHIRQHGVHDCYLPCHEHLVERNVELPVG